VQVNVVCQFYNSYGFLVSIAQHGSGILYKLKSEKVQSTKMKDHYAQGGKIAWHLSMNCNILPFPNNCMYSFISRTYMEIRNTF